MSDSEEEDSDPEPLKRAPLKEFLRNQSDLRIGGDAVEEFEAEIMFLMGILWKEAARNARDRGYKTVQKEDVKVAYDELVAPHTRLMQTSQKLEEMSSEIEELAQNSPVYKDWDSYDE